VHVHPHRARPEEGVDGDDVLEGVRLEGADEGPHGPALELEDPDGVRPADEVEGEGVVEGDVVDVDPDPRGGLDELEGALDRREVAETEEVHLEEAHGLDPVHLVLGDDLRPVPLLLDGDDVGEGAGRDDDGGGVDRVLAAETLEAAGGVDDPPHVGIPGVGGAELDGVRVLVLAGRVVVGSRLGETVGERRLPAEDGRGHHLRHPVADPVREAEDPGGVPHRLLPLDRREGDDLGDVVGAVRLGGVADHLAPVPLVEVHVDVGHLAAARVEEPLEDHPVAERVEVGDPEAVGDDGAGRRAATRTGADADLLRVADEIPDDEEVGGEPHLPDDAELVDDPVAHLGGEGVAVAAGGPLVDEPFEVGLLGLPGGDGKGGEEDATELEADVGPLGDEEGVVARPRIEVVGEEGAHLRRRLQVVVAPLEAEAGGVVDGRPRLDAEEDVVGVVLVAAGVVGVVRREEGGADAPGDLDEVGEDPALGGDAVVLDLDEEVVLPEDVLVFPGRLEGGVEVPDRALVALLAGGVGGEVLGDLPAEAPGRGDDAACVAGEELLVHPGLVVVPVEEGPGGELHEVAVPGVGLGEEGHVVADVLGAGGPVEAAPGGDVRLRPDDRLHPGLLGGLRKVDDPVHDPVVGDGDGRLAVGGGGGGDVADPGGPVEHGELGVEVEVGEGVGHGREGRRMTGVGFPPELSTRPRRPQRRAGTPSSARRPRTRRPISSRMGRTPATSRPAGSSSSQST